MEYHKKPFKEIFLSDWMPAIITALIGGMVIAYLVPMFQTNFAEESALKKRKIELWESVGINFNYYMNFRNRLIYLARYEEINNGLSKELVERKEDYRSKRDQYSNDLQRDFLLCEFYFGSEVKLIIKKYKNWHNQYSTATFDQLPPDEEYAEWRNKIISAIQKCLY